MNRQRENAQEPIAAALHVWRDMTEEELVADGLCTPKEAWEFLGIGHTSLYRMMAEGEIPFVVLLSGVRRIPKAALKRIAAERLVVAKKGA